MYVVGPLLGAALAVGFAYILRGAAAISPRSPRRRESCPPRLGTPIRHDPVGVTLQYASVTVLPVSRLNEVHDREFRPPIARHTGLAA